MTNAVEKAKATLKATTGPEDAFLLAELIHGLGLQERSEQFTALANGVKVNEKQQAECAERIADLWKTADDEGIRRDVEDALPKVQSLWLQRAQNPQTNGNGQA